MKLLQLVTLLSVMLGCTNDRTKEARTPSRASGPKHGNGDFSLSALTIRQCAGSDADQSRVDANLQAILNPTSVELGSTQQESLVSTLSAVPKSIIGLLGPGSILVTDDVNKICPTGLDRVSGCYFFDRDSGEFGVAVANDTNSIQYSLLRSIAALAYDYLLLINEENAELIATLQRSIANSHLIDVALHPMLNLHELAPLLPDNTTKQDLITMNASSLDIVSQIPFDQEEQRTDLVKALAIESFLMYYCTPKGSLSSEFLDELTITTLSMVDPLTSFYGFQHYIQTMPNSRILMGSVFPTAFEMSAMLDSLLFNPGLTAQNSRLALSDSYSDLSETLPSPSPAVYVSEEVYASTGTYENTFASQADSCRSPQEAFGLLGWGETCLAAVEWAERRREEIADVTAAGIGVSAEVATAVGTAGKMGINAAAVPFAQALGYTETANAARENFHKAQKQLLNADTYDTAFAGAALPTKQAIETYAGHSGKALEDAGALALELVNRNEAVKKALAKARIESDGYDSVTGDLNDWIVSTFYNFEGALLPIDAVTGQQDTVQVDFTRSGEITLRPKTPEELQQHDINAASALGATFLPSVLAPKLLGSGMVEQMIKKSKPSTPPAPTKQAMVATLIPENVVAPSAPDPKKKGKMLAPWRQYSREQLAKEFKEDARNMMIAFADVHAPVVYKDGLLVIDKNSLAYRNLMNTLEEAKAIAGENIQDTLLFCTGDLIDSPQFLRAVAAYEKATGKKMSPEEMQIAMNSLTNELLREVEQKLGKKLDGNLAGNHGLPANRNAAGQRIATAEQQRLDNLAREESGATILTHRDNEQAIFNVNGRDIGVSHIPTVRGDTIDNIVGVDKKSPLTTILTHILALILSDKHTPYIIKGPSWLDESRTFVTIGLPTIGGGTDNVRGLSIINLRDPELYIITPTASGKGITINAPPIHEGAPKPKGM